MKSKGAVDVRPRGILPTVIRLPHVAKRHFQNQQTASMAAGGTKFALSTTQLPRQSNPTIKMIPSVISSMPVVMPKLPTSLLVPVASGRKFQSVNKIPL